MGERLTRHTTAVWGVAAVVPTGAGSKGAMAAAVSLTVGDSTWKHLGLRCRRPG